MKISGIFVYPIKSLGGISLSEAPITDRGLLHDRRWMLVDDEDVFLTQRKFPRMALLSVQIEGNFLVVKHKNQPEEQISISLFPSQYSREERRVSVWGDQLPAIVVGEKENQWFSQMLGQATRLVYMPDHAHREVDPAYAISRDLNSFSDGMPFLMIGESSLADLNARLDRAVPMNRFRPNLVFEGGKPYEEDLFGEINIGENTFLGVKPCIRCNLTTVNQETAEVGKEPLRTLASYRRQENKVFFGMNLLCSKGKKISLGQEITVIRSNEPLFS